MPSSSKNNFSSSKKTKRSQALSSNTAEQKTSEKNWSVKIIRLSFLLITFDIAVVLLLQKRLPPEIPLFYGLPEGEDQLTTRLGLLIPAITALIIVLVNLILTRIVDDEFLKKSLIIAGFGVIIFSLATTLKIILLVASL